MYTNLQKNKNISKMWFILLSMGRVCIQLYIQYSNLLVYTFCNERINNYFYVL